jgi:signal transduction histidine kinase/type II secretory pathway pseudopilin PulG
MASARVRVPRTPWLIVTITLAITSVVGGVVLARAVESLESQRVALSMSELINDVESQLEGYALLYAYLPSVVAEPATEVDDGFATGTIGERVAEHSLPLAGFSGLVEFDPDTGGFVGSTAVAGELSDADIGMLRGLGRRALADRQVAHAPPISADGVAYFASAIPVDGNAFVAFVHVCELIVGPDLGDIDVRIIDTATDSVLLETGPISDPPAGQGLITWFGRAVRVEMSPGPAFPTSNGLAAGFAAGGLGVAIAMLLFALGVATRRTAEEQQRQLHLALESVQDKDRFIASVSHELRTPLTVVQGMSSELADRAADFDDFERAEIIGAIAEQSTEMAFLIEDLLVAARSQTDTITVICEPIDVGDQVHLVRETLLRSVRRDIDIAVSDGTPTRAIGDALRFRQVVRNLLTNAFRYGGPNAGVEIRARGTRVETIVWDDGDGVDQSLSEVIFTPYGRAHNSRSQPNSVGLGLTVAKDLVHRMGGTIAYQRENGRTLFIVTLESADPLGSDRLVRAAAPDEPALVDGLVVTHAMGRSRP